MATDNSPPQVRVILTIAFSSAVILFALNFVLRSYFQMMTDEALHDHLRPAEQLIALHDGEKKLLNDGPMPIDKAMAALAQHGRDDYASYMQQADITPQPSNDKGPLVGWTQRPNQEVIDQIMAEQAAQAADAGAPEAGDGGAATPTATDAGAAPAPTKDGGK